MVVANGIAAVESAAVALTVVQPIGFGRSLPVYYAPGVPLTVRLSSSLIGSAAAGYSYAVEDYPPDNWVVGPLSGGGQPIPRVGRLNLARSSTSPTNC